MLKLKKRSHARERCQNSTVSIPTPPSSYILLGLQLKTAHIIEHPTITRIGPLLHAAHKYMLSGWTTRDSSLGRDTREFSLPQNVDTGSGAHRTSNSMGAEIPNRG